METLKAVFFGPDPQVQVWLDHTLLAPSYLTVSVLTR